VTHFNSFGFSLSFLHTLTALGYTTPTPIQAQAIPHVLAGKDLIGIAQTGTGKTAAFALPLLQLLTKNPRPAPHNGCRILVLSPTRELATQIADSFKAYSRGLGLKIAVIFGGVGHAPQLKALHGGLDVLVATPGRLLEHMGTRAARLSNTEFLVLDEVDQMLDLGFVKPLRQIVAQLPTQRQNLFFSATMPPHIQQLAAELLRHPVTVSVAPAATTAERISQKVLLIETAKKRDMLVRLFDEQAMTRTIVFTRTKHGADKVARHLEASKITAAAIHGNKSQNQRERSLDAFRIGKVRVLVATDIAARGIDIEGVTHVINFDLPEVAENYVHRIGRTGRAGAEGIAISLCDSEEIALLKNIEKTTKLRIETIDHRQPSARHNPSAATPAPAPQPRHKRPHRHAQAQTQTARGRHRDHTSAASPPHPSQNDKGAAHGSAKKHGQRHKSAAHKNHRADHRYKFA
jgi:ATP-dependent RNA helicase RhlE